MVVGCGGETGIVEEGGGLQEQEQEDTADAAKSHNMDTADAADSDQQG